MSAQNNIVIRGLRGIVSSSLGRLVVFKILCLGLVVGGVTVACFGLSGAFTLLVEYVPDSTVLRIVAGVIAVVIGLVGLLPVPKGYRAGRVIAYPGERGTVSINLDSVEGSLTRALAKLPEVKKVIRLGVAPTNEQKIVVSAEVIPNKEPSISMRELGYRLSDRIAEMAEHILGENEVATVDVTFPRLGEATADLAPARITEPAVPTEAPDRAEETDSTSLDAVEVPADEDEETLESIEPTDEDDLVLGAGAPVAQEGEAEEDLEEPAAGPDLGVDDDTQGEDDSEALEEPELAAPVYDDEESPGEELGESEEVADSGDEPKNDTKGPGEEENEDQPGW